MVVVNLSSKLKLERCGKEHSGYIGMKCVERVAGYVVMVENKDRT